ncbi:MAG: NYN domain-containing protein [Tindallia sp. MSAO_Bac2]|nr:MAG: NYN domain-containing protein [Tindallia sp. MSAO_Bac2]
MKDVLILDGYNVINSIPELFEMQLADFQGARDKLIEMMAEYQSYRGLDVIIVFDAYKTLRSRETVEMIKGVQVVFTKEKMTADHFIEKKIQELVDRRNVMVVTNDWTEQLMVLGGGASRISVRELQLDLGNTGRGIREAAGKLVSPKEDIAGRLDRKTLEKLENFRRKKGSG